MKENFSERPNRSKKRIWIAAAAAGAVLIAGAVCAAALRSVNTPDTEDGEPVLMATATPSATVAGEEATPAAPAFSAVPLPTQTPEQYRVLSGLYYGDLDPTDSVYDKDSLLEYEYAENTVTLRDQEGNSVLKLELRENGTLLRRTEYYIVYGGRFADRSRVLEFDEDGRLSALYSSGIGPAEESVYRYLEDGTLAETETVFGRSGISTYEYDETGRLLRHTEKYSTGASREYEYGGDGRASAENYYDASGVLSYAAVYEYGGAPAVTITVTYYDENGAPTGMTREEEYDADGRLTRETYRSEKEQILTQTVYRYDAVGDLVVQERTEERPGLLTYKINNEEIYELAFASAQAPGPLSRYRQNEAGEYFLVKSYGNVLVGNVYDDEYDEQGRLIQRTYYFNNRTYRKFHSYSCEYDAQNRKIREAGYNDNAGGGDNGYAYDYRYEYDADGNLVHIKDDPTYSADSEYWFDPAGRLIRLQYGSAELLCEYDEDGTLAGKRLRYRYTDREDFIHYEYAPGGALLRVTARNGNTEWVYDAEGRLNRETEFDDDGMVCEKLEILYDETHRRRESLQYAGEGNETPIRTVYEYNAGGQLIGWTKFDSAGNAVFRYRERYQPETAGSGEAALQGSAEYDENGNLAELASYDANGKPFRGVFETASKDEYELYAKCNIADLLPCAW